MPPGCRTGSGSDEDVDDDHTDLLDDDDDDDNNPLTSSITKSSSSGLMQQLQQQQQQQHQLHNQSFQSSSTASSSSSIASSMTTVIHHQNLQQLHQQVQQQVQLQLTQAMNKQAPILLKGTTSSTGSAMTTTATSASTSSINCVGAAVASVPPSKPKFHSFLQQPETGQFLSTSSQQQQKFVRQFVRSSSAHNDSVDKPSIKCIRSASQQIEDDTTLLMGVENQLQQVQKMSVLFSKSAETIEGAAAAATSASCSSMTTTQMMGTGIRNTLTLSGGLLAPPNRKLTILSPIHAPPGLHDMLKRHGRSPCSPRIMFPSGACGAGGLGGIEADLFG